MRLLLKFVLCVSCSSKVSGYFSACFLFFTTGKKGEKKNLKDKEAGDVGAAIVWVSAPFSHSLCVSLSLRVNTAWYQRPFVLKTRKMEREAQGRLGGVSAVMHGWLFLLPVPPLLPEGHGGGCARRGVVRREPRRESSITERNHCKPLKPQLRFQKKNCPQKSKC